MKPEKWNLSKEAIFRVVFILFLFGIMIGANIAYKEDSGHNLPIPILMIFLIPITIIFYRQIKKGLY